MEPEAAPAGEQAGKMRFMPEGEKATPAEVIQELETTNFIPKKVAAEILGQFPDYLKPVANFIAAQRQKLVAGKITARDLWKSYAMTVASQGTGAVSVDLLKAKLAKEGIDFSPEKLFTDVNKSGVETIRPEEAAAYWLGTEAGKTALDNVEAGEFNASDWEGLVKIRKAYGDDRFKTFNVFSDKNIERIPSVIEKLNNSKGDPKQVLDAVQLLNGVSTGKKGFISHLLGLGNTPTIDAVEINFWLTGKGDVGTIKSKEADLARKIKSTFSDKRVSQAVFNRINDSINDLRSVATGANQVPKEAWSHVMHHWLWDKAKGLETTHAGMYEAQMRFMPEKLDSDYMKAVEVGDVEAQQRMVDEAAKRAGYKQGVLWHGSRGKKFTVFDETKGDRLPWMEGHVGHYFSPDKNIASAMGSNVLGAYLKMDNPLILDAGDYSYSAITPARKKEIQKQGYDSVIGTPQTNAGKQEFIVFDSNQIKSADPITRDNSGKVIPLSKRFDVGSKDIRYMPEGDGINDAVKIARQKLDNIRNSRKESSINWELDKDRLEEEGVKFYITDINLPKDDQYIKQFLPLESIIQGDDKKWYFGDSFGFDTLEDAKDFASDKIKNSLKDFSTSSTFGSDMDAKEVASSIFDAFPKHPSIIKDWNSSKWGSWYLEFKDKNQNKQKISVRDHSASRSDMGLPEKSFYVSKLWNPEEIGVALNDAFEYIQDNGVSRNNEKPKKKSTAKGNSSAIANASKLK
jgi:hypothetical protein